MKKIVLLLVVAIFAWTFESASAQTADTTNKVEVKKKVKTRRKGRNTSIKTVVKGSGNTDAVNGTTSVAVTGKPAPAKSIETPPQTNTIYVPVETPAPAPVIIQAPPVEPKPTPMSTSVTTTTETKQVPVVKTTSTHVVHTTHTTTGTHPVVKKVYKKPAPAPTATVKTTTTTTTTKPTDN